MAFKIEKIVCTTLSELISQITQLESEGTSFEKIEAERKVPLGTMKGLTGGDPIFARSQSSKETSKDTPKEPTPNSSEGIREVEKRDSIEAMCMAKCDYTEAMYDAIGDCVEDFESFMSSKRNDGTVVLDASKYGCYDENIPEISITEPDRIILGFGDGRRFPLTTEYTLQGLANLRLYLLKVIAESTYENYTTDLLHQVNRLVANMPK